MRKSLFQIAVATILFWSVQAEVSFGQKPPPDLALKVEHHPQMFNKVQVKYATQVADRLNKARLEVPPGRLQYFQKMIQPDVEPFGGWHGVVEHIMPTDEGILVTLRVQPIRGHVSDPISLMEQYSIVNGEIHYIKSFVPPLRSRIILVQ